MSFNQNERNYFGQSQQLQTTQRPIRSRSKYMWPAPSAGKRVRASHDWFDLLTNHWAQNSKTKANADYFRYPIETEHLPAELQLHDLRSMVSGQAGTLGHTLRHLGTLYITPLSPDRSKPWLQTHSDHLSQLSSTTPVTHRRSVSVTQIDCVIPRHAINTTSMCTAVQQHVPSLTLRLNS